MKRILVADDDPLNRDILERRLRLRGFEVSVAADGEQALAALAGAPFDVVLLDSLTPNLPGIELLRHMRDGGDHTRVIMVTSKAFEADVASANAVGANGYVTKPVDFPKLLKLIEE